MNFINLFVSILLLAGFFQSFVSCVSTSTSKTIYPTIIFQANPKDTTIDETHIIFTPESGLKKDNYQVYRYPRGNFKKRYKENFIGEKEFLCNITSQMTSVRRATEGPLSHPSGKVTITAYQCI